MKRHLEAAGILSPPVCPYCDEELDGKIVNGLHAKCNETYNLELAAWEADRPGLPLQMPDIVVE